MLTALAWTNVQVITVSRVVLSTEISQRRRDYECTIVLSMKQEMKLDISMNVDAFRFVYFSPFSTLCLVIGSCLIYCAGASGLYPQIFRTTHLNHSSTHFIMGLGCGKRILGVAFMALLMSSG